MSELRALLLTDVVDSTKMSEQIGDAAMAEVWAGHDRVARDLLPRFHGREIDKTDGMLLLFERAEDAVRYALAYHRAIGSLPRPLKARAGLHVGPVILRENSPDDVARGAKPLEVDGLAKPTAARVMSLARGGQTLLTSEALAALGDTGLETQSHGHWVMKGVSQPVELFEVGEDASTFAAPPDGDKVYRVVRSGDRWLPVKDIPNNLPWQPTSFIGRERELDEIKKLLGRVRLLTLLGMGGLGKTRLSLQAAAELMADFPDGVWFMDLAPIRDDALVVSEAAQVLGLREEPGRPLLQTVCHHLKSKRMLFVLDNCEHLIKPTAQLAYAILRAAPQVRFVSSSREALRVPGEQSYPILPLPVPKADDSLEALQQSTAVRLFVERAQAHRFDFALTAAEAPAIASLVARLEGIPLALELAAARVRTLPVAEINQRLKDRYAELVDGDHVLDERQQTLRALVDWSYDMLGRAEQRVLASLAVFAGGFDLLAVQAVYPGEADDEHAVPEVLASLVEKSLVMREPRGDSERFRMLETLRDYAREKLELGAETAAAVAARHCEHYFVLAKQTRVGLQGPEQARWVDTMETEHDNVRVAHALALRGGVDPFIAVKIAVAMQPFWRLRGYVSEGRAAVRAALALPAIQASDMAQSHALYVGAALATSQGDHAEAQQMLERCLALRRGLGNPVDVAATLSTLALARQQAGNTAAAMVHEQEALQIFEALGDRQGVAIGHVHLAGFAHYLGDTAAARAHLQQGLALARDIGHQELQSECTLTLGQLALESGDEAQAREWVAESLRISESSGDKGSAASAHWWRGRIELAAGNAAGARPLLLLALDAFLEYEMREPLLGCLEDVSRLADEMAAPLLAVHLAGACEAARRGLGLAAAPRAAEAWARHVGALRSRLPDSFDAAYGSGARLSLPEAVKLAASLPSCAVPG